MRILAMCSISIALHLAASAQEQVADADTPETSKVGYAIDIGERVDRQVRTIQSDFEVLETIEDEKVDCIQEQDDNTDDLKEEPIDNAPDNPH